MGKRKHGIFMSVFQNTCLISQNFRTKNSITRWISECFNFYEWKQNKEKKKMTMSGNSPQISDSSGCDWMYTFSHLFWPPVLYFLNFDNFIVSFIYSRKKDRKSNCKKKNNNNKVCINLLYDWVITETISF